MKAMLILADAARVHPDATFSLLRGGITKLYVARGKPAAFRGSILVRIVPGLTESGKHEFRVVCTDEDGVVVGGLELSGGFEIPSRKRPDAFQFALDVNMAFPKLGTYQFAVLVDKQEMDTWSLEAVEGPPQVPDRKEKT